MMPEDDIVMVVADAPLSENLIIAHMDLHTRFPVTSKKGDPQAIIGYVTFKDMVLLAKTHPGNPVIREIVRQIISVPENMSLSDALRRMTNEHHHLALVRDAGGQVVGMITQEDIFEELVGDIQDEFDRLPRHISPAGHQLVVGGGVQLGQLRDVLKRPDLGGELPPDHDAQRLAQPRPRGAAQGRRHGRRRSRSGPRSAKSAAAASPKPCSTPSAAPSRPPTRNPNPPPAAAPWDRLQQVRLATLVSEGSHFDRAPQAVCRRAPIWLQRPDASRPGKSAPFGWDSSNLVLRRQPPGGQ